MLTAPLKVVIEEIGDEEVTEGVHVSSHLPRRLRHCYLDLPTTSSNDEKKGKDPVKQNFDVSSVQASGESLSKQVDD